MLSKKDIETFLEYYELNSFVMETLKYSVKNGRNSQVVDILVGSILTNDISIFEASKISKILEILKKLEKTELIGDKTKLLLSIKKMEYCCSHLGCK